MLSEEKRRYFLLSVILILISMTATGSTIFLLYRAAVEERRDDLVATAKSQARLIEAVARYDQKYAALIKDEIPRYDPIRATLQQVIEAHRSYPGFGETGEFVLARRAGRQIVFLFRHHHDRVESPLPVPFDSSLAEPMRRALSGLSGTLVGSDYHGHTVLAAYEPVAVLDLGIVAKVDLAEVRAPFIVASWIAFLITLVLLLTGLLLLKRVITPLFNRLRTTSDELLTEIENHKKSLKALRESEERFRQIAEVAKDAFWLVDCADSDSPKILYLNRAFEQIWQRSNADLLENPVLWTESIHPDDRQLVVTDFFNFLRGEGAFDHEFRILSHAGTLRHIWAKGGLIKDDQGRIIRAAGIAHDISPIKQAEQMVQQANADLEKRIAERTAELNRTIRLMSGREERMAELKIENRQLKARLRQEEVAQ